MDKPSTSRNDTQTDAHAEFVKLTQAAIEGHLSEFARTADPEAKERARALTESLKMFNEIIARHEASRIAKGGQR
jgi:hypothetical protein